MARFAKAEAEKAVEAAGDLREVTRSEDLRDFANRGRGRASAPARLPAAEMEAGVVCPGSTREKGASSLGRRMLKETRR